jgi:hypothetical protein
VGRNQYDTSYDQVIICVVTCFRDDDTVESWFNRTGARVLNVLHLMSDPEKRALPYLFR